MTINPVFSQIEDIINNITPFFLRIKKSDLNLPEFNDHSIINSLNNIEYKIYKRLTECLNNESLDINKSSIFFRLIQSSSNLHLLNKSLNTDFDYDKIFNEETITIPDLLGENLHSELITSLKSYIPSKHENVLNLVKDLKRDKKKVITVTQNVQKRVTFFGLKESKILLANATTTHIN